jgi:hypothetical protein
MQNNFRAKERSREHVIAHSVKDASLGRTTIYAYVAAGRLQSKRAGVRRVAPADSLRALIGAEEPPIACKAHAPPMRGGFLHVTWLCTCIEFLFAHVTKIVRHPFFAFALRIAWQVCLRHLGENGG